MGSFSEHSFYCIQCGNKGIPIMRNNGRAKEKFHRKKLYCLHCKQEINHIECRTEEEVNQFKEDFESGVYLSEVEEIIPNVRPSGLW
jgi:hypothetical protein